MTLIELMVALAAFSILLVSVLLMISKSRTSVIGMENTSDLIILGERASNNLQQAVGSCFRMLAPQITATPGPSTPPVCPGSGAYQDYLALAQNGLSANGSTAPPAVSWEGSAGSASCYGLPYIINPMPANAPQISNTIPSQAGLWGDCLLFVASTPSLRLSSPNVNLDLFQFVYIYLGAVPGKKIPGTGGGPQLSLVEWRSVPYVNYQNLVGLKNQGLLSSTASVLTSAAYNLTLAWDPDGSAATNSFYTISNSSPYVGNSPVTLARLQTHVWGDMTQFISPQDTHLNGFTLNQSRVYNVAGGVAGAPSLYSVAYNTTTVTAAPYRVNLLKGAFATQNQPGASKPFINVPMAAQAAASGFPAGFEVFITGQPSARTLFASIILMAASGASSVNTGFMAAQSTCEQEFTDNF